MQKKLQFYIDGRWVDPVEGRAWGVFGFEEFLEIKAIIGWQA